MTSATPKMIGRLELPTICMSNLGNLGPIPPHPSSPQFSISHFQVSHLE
jgi:hypothetical protein